ncbi:MAG: PilT/PilU family type 4a pilus ATPase [Planctomycetota bacterium]|nr:PilT/PilU family type 4a pilus ATPase [Planctomycetota bacterium]
MAAIDRLLARVKEAGGSDLHLAEGQPPWLRKHGHLAALPNEPALAHDGLAALLREIAPPQRWERIERTGDGTFAYAPDGHTRFRVNCYRQASGWGAVCRFIPGEAPPLQDLGLAPAMKDLAQLHAGLVLLAGPTGSGVSTTVAALCQEINLNQSRRILTLEDPIEYVLVPRRSSVVQRDIGLHARSLAAALREAGREGFDVIYAGEFHDSEVISLALTTAETGALVFGTLRSSSVVRALDHIVSAFEAEQQHWVRAMLANTLRAVSAQVLATKADGSGRCAANEVLIGTPGVASAIREGYISKLSTMIQSGGMDGMVMLDDALMKKVEAKAITPAEAAAKARDRTRFDALAREAEKPAAPGAPAAPPKPPPPPPLTGKTQFVTGPPRPGPGRGAR